MSEEVIDAAPATPDAGTGAGIGSMIQDSGLRDDPSLQSFKDVDSLAKSYVHLNKMMGRDKIVMPTGDDDQDVAGHRQEAVVV